MTEAIVNKDSGLDYDKEMDVMYITILKDYGYEEEIEPGVFLRKSDSNDKIIGATILDFSKKDKLKLSKAIRFDVTS